MSLMLLKKLKLLNRITKEDINNILILFINQIIDK